MEIANIPQIIKNTPYPWSITKDRKRRDVVEEFPRTRENIEIALKVLENYLIARPQVPRYEQYPLPLEDFDYLTGKKRYKEDEPMAEGDMALNVWSGHIGSLIERIERIEDMNQEVVRKYIEDNSPFRIVGKEIPEKYELITPLSYRLLANVIGGVLNDVTRWIVNTLYGTEHYDLMDRLIEIVEKYHKNLPDPVSLLKTASNATNERSIPLLEKAYNDPYFSDEQREEILDRIEYEKNRVLIIKARQEEEKAKKESKK